MQRLKVVTAVGTRPEIIRLSRVLKRLDASEAIEHVLIHTGQNYDYELNKIFFEDLELRSPDLYLDAAGANPLHTIGTILQKVDDALASLKPDAFFVLGDTNSCLSAIAAKKRKIPVFHMEAGNRCFDQRVPEEINRKIVDHIADINLTYSDISRSYLLSEGLPPDRIIKTGSPMFEVLTYYIDKIRRSDIVQQLNLEKEKYFLVSAHREENVDNDDNFLALMDSLQALSETFNIPVIVSTHPRTQRILERHKIKPHALIRFLKPFSFTDYNALQINAFVVLSDSGTISEESSILDFRALNIRNAHERPEASEEMGVMMTGLKKERILQAIEAVKNQKPGERNFRLVRDYAVPNVSAKVERIIISHIDYINRNVWHKHL
jgi:UDP-N-acetyl-L-fucosamine synthase